VAYAYRKGNRWYLGWKDASGSVVRRPSDAVTRAEARRMAQDLERRAERQRLGLEPLPAEDGGGTLSELLQWWLDTYVKGSPSHARTVYGVRKHFQRTELGALRLIDVSPGRLEEHLQKRAADYAPQTLNHLRTFILQAFNRARKSGRWTGPNPAEQVKPRRVAQRLHDYLRAEEVPKVLAALHPRWRPLFAAAVFTGMRKGELLALRKRDIDFRRGLITVGRSWGRDIPKGGRVAAIPIATELRPFLEEAVEASPSELVFPHVCASSCAYQKRCPGPGAMMRPDVALESVLRRAMGRAGLADSWQHECRRCRRTFEAPDAEQRRCPRCQMLLWPKPRVRPIRFHDLRHTTASLLMQAGAPVHAVQRILRHRDPRMTANVYGHLAPDYLQSEMDRLRFGLWPSGAEGDSGERTRARVSARQLTPHSPRALPSGLGAEAPIHNVPPTFMLPAARSTGLEPVTSGVTGRRSNQLN